MKTLQNLILQTKPSVVTTQPTPKPTSKSKKQQPAAKSAAPLKKKPYRKQKISAALREQVWVQHNGHVFEKKCAVTWCTNTITVFNFQCGHDIPESKGGPTNITNLYPICGKCNLSMSNTYTFKEWCTMYESKDISVATSVSISQDPLPKKSFWKRWLCCFR
jgi:5-methylcytosine-specific restriction endonuclease McrA